MPPTSTLKQPRSSTRNIDARATPAVIAIFGPTASGKSAVAAALGERLEGVLVGADAMQVYQGVPILTNQSPEPTELVSIWPLDYDASVGDYAPRAHAVIDAALAAGGFPVVVGGTGLYLRAALAELDIPPPAPPGTRERLESLYERDGGRQAHALLTQRDPLAAAAVHVNDQRRVIRALELVEVGRTLHPASPTLWTEATRYPTLVVGLEVRPELLEERIVDRAAKMIADGARAEAQSALAGPISATARRIIGLREAAELDGEAAARAIALKTRRYAAYQRKWLRRIPNISLIDAEAPAEALADEVLEMARAR